MKNCRIQHYTENDLDIVQLDGSLDVHSFPRLEAMLRELIGRERTRVVLDCALLEYVSSATLGALIGFARQARGKGGDLRLAGVPSKILGIIELLGFDKVLSIHPDRAAAVQGFES